MNLKNQYFRRSVVTAWYTGKKGLLEKGAIKSGEFTCWASVLRILLVHGVEGEDATSKANLCEGHVDILKSAKGL
jgi:hypothetical protein